MAIRIPNMMIESLYGKIPNDIECNSSQEELRAVCILELPKLLFRLCPKDLP